MVGQFESLTKSAKEACDNFSKYESEGIEVFCANTNRFQERGLEKENSVLMKLDLTQMNLKQLWKKIEEFLQKCLYSQNSSNHNRGRWKKVAFKEVNCMFGFLLNLETTEKSGKVNGKPSQ